DTNRCARRQHSGSGATAGGVCKMRFAWPLALLALLLVPLAGVAYLALEHRRAKYAIQFTNIDVLASVAEGTSRWRQYAPAALAALALSCALAALARPEGGMSVASE